MLIYDCINIERSRQQTTLQLGVSRCTHPHKQERMDRKSSWRLGYLRRHIPRIFSWLVIQERSGAISPRPGTAKPGGWLSRLGWELQRRTPCRSGGIEWWTKRKIGRRQLDIGSCRARLHVWYVGAVHGGRNHAFHTCSKAWGRQGVHEVVNRVGAYHSKPLITAFGFTLISCCMKPYVKPIPEQLEIES